MTIEITLLQSLSIRENLVRYKHLVNPKTLSIQSITLLKDYEVYFELYPECQQLDWSDFNTFFFQNRHPYLDDSNRTEYKEVLRLIATTERHDNIKNLITSFEQQELYSDLQRDLDKNHDIKDIQTKVHEFLIKKQSLNKADSSEQSMDLEEALGHVDRTEGLVWRNEALKQHFGGGLIRGDFGIVAGYTDSGKTSFLSSELSYMAQQLHDDQYILWLNNEGDWRRILPRIYSATLNCTQADLIQHKQQAAKQYTKKMHGNPNRIKIMDIQGQHIKDVERLLCQNPPSLLVFDMLDHLRGFEKFASSEGSHERYGMLYQWAREMSSQYCPIIATSQLNREGSNCMYPDITNMKGSGVDKQAAAVYILMIGALNGDDSTRYLSTPKFKIGGNKSWKASVRFDSQRSRFI